MSPKYFGPELVPLLSLPCLFAHSETKARTPVNVLFSFFPSILLSWFSLFPLRKQRVPSPILLCILILFLAYGYSGPESCGCGLVWHARGGYFCHSPGPGPSGLTSTLYCDTEMLLGWTVSRTHCLISEANLRGSRDLSQRSFRVHLKRKRPKTQEAYLI